MPAVVILGCDKSAPPSSSLSISLGRRLSRPFLLSIFIFIHCIRHPSCCDTSRPCTPFVRLPGSTSVIDTNGGGI